MCDYRGCVCIDFLMQWLDCIVRWLSYDWLDGGMMERIFDPFNSFHGGPGAVLTSLLSILKVVRTDNHTVRQLLVVLINVLTNL